MRLQLWNPCVYRVPSLPHMIKLSLNSHLENCIFDPIFMTFLSTGILSETSSRESKAIAASIWLNRDDNRTPVNLPATSTSMHSQIKEAWDANPSGN